MTILKEAANPYGFWFNKRTKKTIAVKTDMGHRRVAGKVLGEKNIAYRSDQDSVYAEMYSKGWVRGSFSDYSVNITATKIPLRQKDAEDVLAYVATDLNLSSWPKKIHLEVVTIKILADPDAPSGKHYKIDWRNNKYQVYTTANENINESITYGFWHHPKLKRTLPASNAADHLTIARRVLKSFKHDAYYEMFAKGWIRGVLEQDRGAFSLEWGSHRPPTEKMATNIALDVIEYLDINWWPSLIYVDVIKLSKDFMVQGVISKTYYTKMSENLNETNYSYGMYGFWYDPKTKKAWPVADSFAHAKVGKNILIKHHKFSKTDPALDFDKYGNYYDATAFIYHTLLGLGYVRGLLFSSLEEIGIESIKRMSEKQVLNLVGDLATVLDLNWWPRVARVDVAKLKSPKHRPSASHSKKYNTAMSESQLTEAVPYGFWYNLKNKKIVAVSDDQSHIRFARKIVGKNYPENTWSGNIYFGMYKEGWLRGVISNSEYGLEYAGKLISKKEAVNITLDVIDKFNLNTWPKKIYVDIHKLDKAKNPVSIDSKVYFVAMGESILEVLAKDKDGWVLKSKKTNKVLRRWDTKPTDEQVAKAEREIQYFKHKNKSESLEEFNKWVPKPYGFWYDLKKDKVYLVPKRQDHSGTAIKINKAGLQVALRRGAGRMAITTEMIKQGWVRGVFGLESIDIQLTSNLTKKRAERIVLEVVSQLGLDFYPKIIHYDVMDSTGDDYVRSGKYVFNENKQSEIDNMIDSLMNLQEEATYGFWYLPKTKKYYPVPMNHFTVGKRVLWNEHKFATQDVNEVYYELLNRGWVRGVWGGRAGNRSISVEAVKSRSDKQNINMILDIIDAGKRNTWPTHAFSDVVTLDHIKKQLGSHKGKKIDLSFSEGRNTGTQDFIMSSYFNLTEANNYGFWYNIKTKKVLIATSLKDLYAVAGRMSKKPGDSEAAYAYMFNNGWVEGTLDMANTAFRLSFTSRANSKSEAISIVRNAMSKLNLKWTPDTILVTGMRALKNNTLAAGQSKTYFLKDDELFESISTRGQNRGVNISDLVDELIGGQEDSKPVNEQRVQIKNNDITTSDFETWYKNSKVYHKGNAASLKKKVDADRSPIIYFVHPISGPTPINNKPNWWVDLKKFKPQDGTI